MSIGQITCVAHVPRFAAPRNHMVPELTFDRDKSYTYTPALADTTRFRDTPLKYRGPFGLFAQDELSEVCDHIISILKKVGFDKTDPLNFDGSTAAVSEWNSSPGYPHVLQSFTKRDMLENYREEMIYDFESDRVKGFHSDIPKGDEYLKTGKRIRQLTAVEFPVMLQQARFCSHFNANLKRFMRYLPIKLGVSKENGGWNEIIQQMLKCSLGLAQDATGHDTSIPREVLMAVRYIREAFLNLTDKERATFHELYESIISKYIVDLDGFVFECNGGVPSGYFNTSEDNSLISWIFVCLFFRHRYGEHWRQAMNDYVVLIYGDDVWYGFKKRHDVELFSPEELRTFWWSRNYVVKAKEWVHPFEADFLSTRVVDHPELGIINVHERGLKLLEAMDHIDGENYGDVELRIRRLLAMREQLAGLPEFSLADDKVRVWWGKLPKSLITPQLEKLFYGRRTERQIIDKRMARVHYQSKDGFELNRLSHPILLGEQNCWNKPSVNMSSVAKKVVKAIKAVKAQRNAKAPRRRARNANKVRKPRKQRQGEVLQRSVALVRNNVVKRNHMEVHQISRGSLDKIRISGTETISDVNSTAAWTGFYSQPISPANTLMFPKAADIAALYEQWRVGPKGIKFEYVMSCPSTRSGTIAAYWDGDVTDSVAPTTVTMLMNQQYHFTGAMYTNHSMHIPPHFQSDKWFFCQTTKSNSQADRNAFYGALRAFTTNAATADNATFSGFIRITYDLEFQNFRPPETAGFSLVNLSDSALTNTVTQYQTLSDGVSPGNLSGTGGRYQWLTDLVANVGLPKRRFITPPVGATSPVTALVTLGPDSVDKSVALRSPRASTLASFIPYECVQSEDGSWSYRTGPNGPLTPYTEMKHPDHRFFAHPTTFFPAPEAFGDYKLSIVAFDPSGTGTELAFVSGTTISAFTKAVGALVIPAVPTWLSVAVNVAIAASRVVDACYTFCSGAITNSGD